MSYLVPFWLIVFLGCALLWKTAAFIIGWPIVLVCAVLAAGIVFAVGRTTTSEPTA